MNIELDPNKIEAGKKSALGIQIRTKKIKRHVTINCSLPSNVIPKGKTRFRIGSMKPNKDLERTLKLKFNGKTNQKINKELKIKIIYRDKSGNPKKREIKKKFVIIPQKTENEKNIKNPDIIFDFTSDVEIPKDTYKKLICEISNVGEGIAKNVKTKLTGRITGGNQKKIDILKPGDTENVVFYVKPYSKGELELGINLAYLNEKDELIRNQEKKSLIVKESEKKEKVINIHEDYSTNVEDNSISIKDDSTRISDSSTKIKDSAVVSRGEKDILDKGKKRNSIDQKQMKGDINKTEDHRTDIKDSVVLNRKSEYIQKSKEETKIKCESCGKKIRADWNFCPFCKKRQ